MTRLTCLFAAMVLAVAACSGGDGEAAANGPTADEAAAEAADPASLEATFEYFDGSDGTLADYEGRPLVVNFFASWCVPCVREMPAFEEVHQELGDEVAFLGFNVRDQLEDGRRIAERTGVTYDLARDPAGSFLAAVKGAVMPTTALVNAEGEVVEVHSGALEAGELRDLVRAELLS